MRNRDGELYVSYVRRVVVDGAGLNVKMVECTASSLPSVNQFVVHVNVHLMTFERCLHACFCCSYDGEKVGSKLWYISHV